MYKKLKKNIMLSINKCYVIKNFEKLYFRSNILKNKIYLNLFFNINDTNDDLYYLFYDVFYWTNSKKWYLFKPHYLSYFFFFLESKKWRYVRLLNNHNKKLNITVSKHNLQILNIWFFWKKKQQDLLQQYFTGYFFFKLVKKNFKFKQYYFFFKNNNFFIFNRIKKFNNNLYRFIFFFYYVNYNLKFLKKNNQKFLYNIFQNFLYKTLNNDNIYFNIIYNINLFKYVLFKKHIIIKSIYILIKEKHKLKNFLSNLNFINYIFKLRELSIFLDLISKKRLRKKKGEVKLVLKKKILFIKQKKRTNMQILKALIKKNIIRKQLYFNLIYNKNYNYINLNTNLIFKNFNILNFTNLKFNYLNELFYDLDALYVRFLPRNRKLHFLNVLTDDYSDLWRGFFNKKLIFNLKLIKIKLINNIIGDINLYNKYSLNKIYKILCNSNKIKDLKQKKKYFLLKNILTYLRFCKNNNFILGDLYFIFNIYFWLTVFFIWLNKSKFINIKSILDFTSFLQMIDLLYRNKFSWFNLIFFEVFIKIITYNNLIIKLKCDFEFLLQEVCLYLYFLIFKIKSDLIFERNNVKKKIQYLQRLHGINFIFKGNITFENNYLLCLNIIKSSVNVLYFYDLIVNFFNNCQNSISFIKRNLKLYWGLLELSYSIFDNYNLKLLNNLNLNNEVLYFRYKNSIIYGTKKNTKNILDYLLKNYILYFLYYYLQFYFFFCIWINLQFKNLLFFGYSICLEDEKVKISIDNFEIYKLLFYYNFVQITKRKITIKPAHYLLNLPITRILNYFFNIWLELVIFYYNFDLKFLVKYKYILLKVCFLTIFLKLKKKKIIINFRQFKNIFNFNFNKKKKLKKKKIKNYILKNNQIKLITIFNKKNFK